MMGLTPGVHTEFWHFGSGQDICGEMHLYTDALLADASPPLVNTISFGVSEAAGELLSLKYS